MTVHSLGYLRLSSTDVDEWRSFGTDVLGMTATQAPQPGGVALRMDEYLPRLVVVPGESSDVDGIGFEVGNAHDLDDLEKRLRDTGVSVRRGDPAECEERGVRSLLFCEDPLGMPLEFFNGPARIHEPLDRSHVGGFVTGNLGMGHVVLGGPEAPEADQFYRDVLGFVERNTMKSKTAEGTREGRHMAFLGCNARHHTAAFIEMPGESKLIHFMVEVATIDDVGRTLDRALAREIPQRLSLGRHTNDHMVSFYSYTPDGHTIEVGCDGLLVGPDTPTYEITETSYWGHRRIG